MTTPRSHLSAIQKNARKIAMDSFVEGRMDDGKRILEVEGVNLTKSQAETVAKQLTAQRRRDDALAVLTLVMDWPLLKALISAGVPTDHLEGDLYVLDTRAARDILAAHGKKGFVSFISQIDGKRWLDVPFGYEPFWEKKTARRR